MTIDHDRLLGDHFLDGLSELPLDAVRARRAECVEVETGLSYLRRMVQGPLDLVRREQARRAGGEAPSDLSTVVDELPDVLADATRPGGNGRLSQTLEPTEIDPVLAAELAATTGGEVLSRLGDEDDDALEALVEKLTELERRISEQRRAYFTQIDALQAEITRRYRDGEATVDALLAPSE